MPDVNLNILIRDVKIQEFKLGFLEKHPIPTRTLLSDEDTGVPLFTAKRWMEVWLERQAFGAYRQGKELLRGPAVVDDAVLG